MKSKYIHTQHTDRAIAEAYASENYGKGVINTLSRKMAMPIHSIRRRAVSIGVVKNVPIAETHWSEMEIRFLEKWAHLDSHTISKKLAREGFRRTPNAVLCKRARLGIEKSMARLDRGIYSTPQLAESMGCCENLINGWIHKGLLKAEVIRQPNHGGTLAYRIREKDIRDFIVTHTSLVDFRKADKFWLVDILCPSHGAKINVL